MNSEIVEEEGILPILHQVKAFQSKWIAKNKQCETLDSFLTTANEENKQLQAANEKLKSVLNTANIKIKDLEDTCEALKSSLNITSAENKKLDAECKVLKKSLDFTNVNMKELRFMYEKSESELIISNTKKENLQMKCREVEVKYTALESSLHAANAKIEDLEVKLNECKKKMVKIKLEKKKVMISTLKKFQNNLAKNPLCMIIDRLKHNITALDEAAKNNSQNLRRNDNKIEVIEIVSSDDDDDNASTLSITSKLRNKEEDFNFNVNLPSSVERLNVSPIGENIEVAVQISDIKQDKKQNSVGSITCDTEAQNIFIDDGSSDSNIGCVCTKKFTPTAAEHLSKISSVLIAEEHSYFDRAPILPEKCLINSVENHIGATNENITTDQTDRNPDLGIRPIPIPESVASNFSNVLNSQSTAVLMNSNKTECNNECPSLNNYIDTIIANLIKKYGKKLTLLHPVISLTPIDEYKRIEVQNSIEMDDSHSS